MNVYAETWSCVEKGSDVVTVFSREGKSIKSTTQYDIDKLQNIEYCKRKIKPQFCKTGFIENTYKIYHEDQNNIIINRVTTNVTPSFTNIYVNKNNKLIVEQRAFHFDHSTYLYNCAVT